MLCLTPILLGMSLYTHHFSGGAEVQNQTPGIYLQTKCGVTLGTYENSIGARSVVLAYTLPLARSPFSLTMGAVSGYGPRETPFLLPTYTAPLGETPYSLRLGYVPKWKDVNKYDGVNIQFITRF